MGHRALLLGAAREALLRDPEAALPARAVIVHGFADATGLRAELIEALARYRHAAVLIDEPPDPAAPGVADAGRRFTERLRARLLGVAGERVAEPVLGRESEIARVEAASPDAEVRDLAARVRRALDAGTPPERIGVVARDLSGYRSALRLHFGRLGIPFSGASPGGVGPLARRAGALDVLLRERAACRTSRWLDAARQLASRAPRARCASRCAATACSACATWRPSSPRPATFAASWRRRARPACSSRA